MIGLGISYPEYETVDSSNDAVLEQSIKENRPCAKHAILQIPLSLFKEYNERRNF